MYKRYIFLFTERLFAYLVKKGNYFLQSIMNKLQVTSNEFHSIPVTLSHSVANDITNNSRALNDMVATRECSSLQRMESKKIWSSLTSLVLVVAGQSSSSLSSLSLYETRVTTKTQRLSSSNRLGD